MKKRKEIFDDVVVVHTGLTMYRFNSRGESIPREVIEMYDLEGNRFYTNCESMEEANKLVEELAKENVEAIIGIRAPWTSPSGELVSNQETDAVGVYIKKIEKNDDFSKKKTR